MDMTYSRIENRESTKRPQSQRACSLSTTSVGSCYSSQWKPVSISVSYFFLKGNVTSAVRSKYLPVRGTACLLQCTKSQSILAALLALADSVSSE